MREGLELPPELAASIELTAEYRTAMGLPPRHRPDPPGVPMPASITEIPEWRAAKGLITAEEYLSCFGYSDQPIQLMKNGQAGENKLWKKKRARKRRSVVGPLSSL